MQIRLYIVGFESAKKLARILLNRDISYQIIDDAFKTGEISYRHDRLGGIICYLPTSYANEKDCKYMLKIWGKDGKYPLIQIGEILNWNDVNALFAVPSILKNSKEVNQLMIQLNSLGNRDDSDTKLLLDDVNFPPRIDEEIRGGRH